MNTNNNTEYEYINKLYGETTLSGNYAASIIICILVTFFILSLLTYSIAMQKQKEIYADWNNNRCKPEYIPIAGFIAAPEGQSINDYTMENFQYCLNSQATASAGYLLQPITFITSSLVALVSNVWSAIDAMRAMFARFRNNLMEFIKLLLGKLLNIISPIIVIFVKFLDSLQKTQGVLVTGLYTMMTMYDTIAVAINSVLDLINVMLGIMIAIIVILWLIPGIGWVTALSLSGVYIAIAIILIVLRIFYSLVFKTPPGKMPKKLVCFDKNVLFKMENGQDKCIYDIRVGDILENGDKVTAKMKLDASNSRMFNIRGIIVSETHIVKHGAKWVPVSNHPEAVEIHGYSEPYIYCLNTNSKRIELNGLIFTDWDEIYDESLEVILDMIPINLFEKDHSKKCMNIHRYLDVGFDENMVVDLSDNTSKKIKDIQINDVLLVGGKVYGIVEIETSELFNPIHKNNIKKIDTQELSLGNKLYHLLTDNKIFSSNNKIISDYNSHIDKILKK
jgi:hypothetical protein